jgi:hypothetical protein
MAWRPRWRPWLVYLLQENDLLLHEEIESFVLEVAEELAAAFKICASCVYFQWGRISARPAPNALPNAVADAFTAVLSRCVSFPP